MLVNIESLLVEMAVEEREDEAKKRLDHVQTELQTRWRAG